MFAHLFGHWRWGQGFWSLHLDTLSITVMLACAVAWACLQWARSPEMVPRNRMETLLDGLATMACRRGEAIGASALQSLWGAFCMAFGSWILMANLMSFIPPTTIGQISSWVLASPCGWVPTSDPNCTFALALTSMLLVQGGGWKAHGSRSFWLEKASHPLPHWCFAPVNIPLNFFSEFLARSVSLAFRLFANMLIGDGGYVLIATALPFWAQWAPSCIWSALHLLIVPLQAYIFLTITDVYGQMAIGGSKHAHSKGP